MSLVCAECGQALAKSESLPGREGTLVHPVLRAISDIKDLERGSTKKPTYVESDHNLALCFSCIESNVPEERKHIIKSIYDFFEMEMRRIEYQELRDATLLSSKFLAELEKIDTKLGPQLNALTTSCLLTGAPIGTGLPYFTANVIDRERSSKGSGFFGPTYQIFGTIRETGIKIPISFDAFRTTFPAMFEDFSCSIQKIQNKGGGLKTKITNDIYLGPGIKEELEKSSGKPLDEIIKEMSKGGLGNVRVIYRDGKQRSKQ